MPMLWDGLKLLALVAIIYGLAAVFLLQEDYLTAQFEHERAGQHALLGEPVANFAETRARNLFTRLVVNTGTLRDSFNQIDAAAPSSATPTSTTALPSTGGSGGELSSNAQDPAASPASSAATPTVASSEAPPALKNVSAWTNQRMRVIWTILFMTMVRVSYALLWWPFLVLTLVPALVDAIALRKIQSTTFALTSPQLQGFVMRALPLLLVGYFLWIFLPFSEHPLTVPVGIAVTSAMCWLGIVQFAKRG